MVNAISSHILTCKSPISMWWFIFPSCQVSVAINHIELLFSLYLNIKSTCKYMYSAIRIDLSKFCDSDRWQDILATYTCISGFGGYMDLWRCVIQMYGHLKYQTDRAICITQITLRWKCDVSAIIESATLLVSQIQSIVQEIASDKYKVGQLPVTISTFTNERKLYLSPGVNMRTTHPESLRKPILPNPRKTEIKYEG